MAGKFLARVDPGGLGELIERGARRAGVDLSGYLADLTLDANHPRGRENAMRFLFPPGIDRAQAGECRSILHAAQFGDDGGDQRLALAVGRVSAKELIAGVGQAIKKAGAAHGIISGVEGDFSADSIGLKFVIF